MEVSVALTAQLVTTCVHNFDSEADSDLASFLRQQRETAKRNSSSKFFKWQTQEQQLLGSRRDASTGGGAHVIEVKRCGTANGSWQLYAVALFQVTFAYYILLRSFKECLPFQAPCSAPGSLVPYALRAQIMTSSSMKCAQLRSSLGWSLVSFPWLRT